MKFLMSISAHCFYNIPCVKPKMEPLQNCTASGAVIGSAPVFRRCRKLRPFGFSAALKHFLLRPDIQFQRPSFLPPLSHSLLLLLHIYGVRSNSCLSDAIRFYRIWCRTFCFVIETQLLTWQDSGLVVLRGSSTPGKHQSARRQHSKDSGHIF